MTKSMIHTIDLKFKGIEKSIGVFLVQHQDGGILIECGPGSTLPALTEALEEYGLTPRDISDVFLTHIHLDHAGSAGWWARQGARIHVHEFGAPHMLNPEKLLASAKRIYGDQMDSLWGEFLPVPEDKLNILRDGDIVRIANLEIKAIDTPGHARHHFSYLCQGVCFTGDVGGCRLPGIPFIRLPSVPPEFHLETWRATLQKLRQEEIQAIAPTHFGLHTDVNWHLDALETILDETEAWIEAEMPQMDSRETLRQKFAAWVTLKGQDAGLPSDLIGAYDIAISSEMSADGIWRYWYKFRHKGD